MQRFQKITLLHTCPIALRACFFSLICLTSVSHASSPPADSVHVCLPFDYEQWRRDHPRPAAKRLANLNVGEPRTVRMIYFLPNDRAFRQEVVDSMKVTMRQIQVFYADQMATRGYGRQTFRFETDAQGEPLVHRMDGKYPDSHYLDDTVGTVYDEVEQAFDMDVNIYFIVIDNSINRIVRGGVRTVLGVGGRRGKNGGGILVPGGFSFYSAAHELGHAFGLWHDFRDVNFIMSYGFDQRPSLSACNAEYLAVHPYFDSDIPEEATPGPTTELISPPEYPTGSNSVSIQLKVSDSDGLHQVLLFVRTRKPHVAIGQLEVKACRGLSGEKDTIVEFDYDGVIPSHGGTSLSDPLDHPIRVQAVDTGGNVRRESFNLVDVATRRNAIATIDNEHIYSLSFSPDGTILAFGTVYGTVRLWDVASQRAIATLDNEYLSGVNSVSFSPDGTILASESGNTVKLWDVSTRTNIATFEGHTSSVESVSFSPDGTMLASGSRDSTVKLWDVASQRAIATLEGHTNRVESVSFSPDGTTLASGSWDDTIKLWDVASQRAIATLEGHTSSVESVSFSPDGTMLASGSSDHTVKLWNVATRRNTATLEHTDGGRSVSFFPDGTMLASGSYYERTVKLWDIATQKAIARLEHTSWILSVSFSPDGKMLASASTDGTVKLWDTSEWLRPRPSALAKISGDNQQGAPDAALANPLVVELRDQNGAALLLKGVPVTFTVTAGNGKLGGRFIVENTTTDANGRAQSTLTLGPTEGTNTVEVSGTGLVPVTFNAVGVGSPAIPIMGGDYRTWYLPDGAIFRLGKGTIGKTDRAVAFSPDGQCLAVASSIGVWLYEMATSRPLVLLSPGSSVSSVVFSPDGTMLASGSDDRVFASGLDNTVKLWDVAQQRNIATLEGHTGPIYSVSFSPDGMTLASGSYDSTVKLWDVATQRNIATLEGHTGLVGSVSFSPDGTMLASGSSDDTVKLWDVAQQRNIATLEGHTDWVSSVSFSPDGTILASAANANDGTVRLWDIATQRAIATLRPDGNSNWVYAKSVSFSPDGTILASAAWNEHEVKLWDVSTRRAIATLEHTNGVNSLSFSPDGTMLASGANDGTVRLWDVETRNAVIFTRHQAFYSVSFSPDGTTLASGSSDGIAKLWDVETQRAIATLEHTYGVNSMSFSPDGTILASGGGNRTVKLWDVETQRAIATLEHTRAGGVESVLFSPDGTILASKSSWSSRPGTVKLWDVATQRNIATLEHTDGVRLVSFSPDGTILALVADASADTVRLWDIATQRNIATLEHTYGVNSVSFSPDGTMLASGGRYGIVKLWDVATQRNIATLEGHTKWVDSVVFSPDGIMLASGGGNRTVKLWDVATQRNIATLEGHTSAVSSVSFSPDGTMLASMSYSDGTILLWDMSPYITSQTPASVLTSDFDGDGTVGVSDFLLFANQFGLSQGDAGYDARYDLDGDGTIGIGDFLIFGDAFGQEGT